MGKNGTKTGSRPITNGQCCQTLRANEEYVETRPGSILTRRHGSDQPNVSAEAKRPSAERRRETQWGSLLDDDTVRS